VKIRADVNAGLSSVSLLELELVPAVRAHLQAKLAGFRCEEHGEAPRLVEDGDDWTIAGCCAASVERASRGFAR
jgi:hypothetical protein